VSFYDERRTGKDLVESGRGMLEIPCYDFLEERRETTTSVPAKIRTGYILEATLFGVSFLLHIIKVTIIFLTVTYNDIYVI
jgi:hypothetical protein